MLANPREDCFLNTRGSKRLFERFKGFCLLEARDEDAPLLGIRLDGICCGREYMELRSREIQQPRLRIIKVAIVILAASFVPVYLPVWKMLILAWANILCQKKKIFGEIPLNLSWKGLLLTIFSLFLYLR